GLRAGRGRRGGPPSAPARPGADVRARAGRVSLAGSPGRPAAETETETERAVNQIGDKPEEVRRHHEEVRRAAGGEDPGDRPEHAERAGDAPEEDHAYGAAPDDADDAFDAYEEPEDRP
ncbi:hypothetical protein, partial [Streptomyces somaliensis]|uniref:hypothetical protein n=1 Tax=Streptomyces somaliensis TaxID=78355 RepID=UPI00263B5F7C